MKKPIIQEKFTDDGNHSYWEIINAETGVIIWSENIFNPDDYECIAGVCPFLDHPRCESCTLKRLRIN